MIDMGDDGDVTEIYKRLRFGAVGRLVMVRRNIAISAAITMVAAGTELAAAALR